MMVFRTRTNYSETKATDPGLPYSKILIKSLDDDGHPCIVDTGQYRHDYELIQAYLDDTKVSTIVSKYESGDKSVLAKTQGLYADITGHASSLQEAKNSLIRVQNFYDRTPIEVRKKFDTLPKFIQALGGDELRQMLIPASKVDSPGADPVPVHKAEVTDSVDPKHE
jgi:hypothetical protein